MYIIKNALKCISRSVGRNVLIGIIVLVISVSSCVGLSIRHASESAKEDTLSGMKVTAAISVNRQAMMNNINASGEKFDKSQFFNKMGNMSSLSLEDYEKYAKAESVQDFYYTLTASLNGTDSFEAVSSEESSEESSSSAFGNPGGFGGNPMGGGKFGMNSGDFSLIGVSGDKAMTSFVDGTSSISSGKVFDEGTSKMQCIISKELASFNNVSVGDKIVLSNPNAEDETYSLSVVGIYTDSSSNESFQTMPGSDPANKIYLSYTALNKIIEKSKSVSTTATDSNTGREYETALSGNLNGTYAFADTDSYYKFEEEVRTLGLSEDYDVSSQDIQAFQNSILPLETLSTMATWFLLVILIIGAVILVVMNIFSIRERKYEIGVLMAIGMKKSGVAIQFLTEVFAVTMVAVILGVGIGGVSAVPLTNALLEKQIESTETESSQITQNFGRGEMPNMGAMSGNMQKPNGNGFGKSPVNYVSKINSAMNLTVVLQMLLIAILLTLTAGAVSMLLVMRYEPLKILANRD